MTPAADRREQMIDLQDFMLQASFHTLELWIPGHIDFSSVKKDVITSQSWKHDKSKNKYTKIIINPNKMVDNNPKGILKFKEFDETLDRILTSFGVETYRINRSDLRMDSYDKNHYNKYQKLYRYLISSFMTDRKFKNSYESRDILSGQLKSIAIHSDICEIEYYNRELKSKQRADKVEPAKSRFEIRSCRSRWKERYESYGYRYAPHETNMKMLHKEFMDYWINRLKKYSDSSALEAARTLVNKSIVADYQPGEKYTYFVNRHAERIYTTGQLQQLIEFIGMPNPENRAKQYKRGHTLITYKDKDIKTAVGIMITSITDFFS